MLICLSKKGFSFLWKSNTWIYWICVLTVCYTIQYFKLRHVTFMAEVWQSKWPCCTRSWWGWCESGFWNHYPGKLNLHNIEVLPLWMTPFLKLFCWVFLKLTYHCSCQIQKFSVKLSQTSTDQIQTTTLALFKLFCWSSLLLSFCIWLNCFIWIKAGFIRCNSLIIQELLSCFYGLLLLTELLGKRCDKSCSGKQAGKNELQERRRTILTSEKRGFKSML